MLGQVDRLTRTEINKAFIRNRSLVEIATALGSAGGMRVGEISPYRQGAGAGQSELWQTI
jgi:hypothetical protein